MTEVEVKGLMCADVHGPAGREYKYSQACS